MCSAAAGAAPPLQTEQAAALNAADHGGGLLAEPWTAWRTTGRRQDFVEVGTFCDRRHFWRVWRELRVAAIQATGFAWKGCVIREGSFPLERTVFPRLEVVVLSPTMAIFEEVWSRAIAALVGERLPGVVALTVFPAQRAFELHFTDTAATAELSYPLHDAVVRQTLAGIPNATIRFVLDNGASTSLAFASIACQPHTQLISGTDSSDSHDGCKSERSNGETACSSANASDAINLSPQSLGATSMAPSGGIPATRKTPEGLLFKRLRALRKKIRSGHQLLFRKFPQLNSAEREKVARLAELIQELHLCEEEARLLGIFPAESELITVRDGSDSGSLGHDDDGDGDEALGPDPTEFPSEYREWIKERIRSSTIRHREHMEQIVDKLQVSTAL